jgi:hypothetical protein
MPTIRQNLPTRHLTPATAIANVAWSQGLRRGDGRPLSVVSEATPRCSALLLTLLGMESLITWRLLIGAVAVVPAGMMSHTDSKRGLRIRFKGPLFA